MLSLGGIFDVDRKERRLEEVNREMENPDLWNNPEHAQKISKEKKTLEDLCGSFKRLTSGIADAKELFEMSLADNDEAGAETVAAEVEGFEKDVEKLEFKRMFNQPMDSANCYLEIQAGAGGTEAQDWASMLERMYLRYAERSGFPPNSPKKLRVTSQGSKAARSLSRANGPTARSELKPAFTVW